MWWVLEAVRIQLVLSLCSIPILTSWGLPISIVAVVGNIVFMPFMMLFLCCSLILWVAVLCSLPAALPVYCLESVVRIWMYCLSKGSSGYVYAIPKQPVWLLIIFTIISLYLIGLYIHRYSLVRSILFLGFFLGTWITVIWIMHDQPAWVSVPCGSRAVYVISDSTGKIMFLDKDGVLRNSPGMLSWAFYTLRTSLATEFGSLSCDEIVIIQPSYKRLKAAVLVGSTLSCDHISVPAWVARKRWFEHWRRECPSVQISYDADQKWTRWRVAYPQLASAIFDKSFKNCHTDQQT